MNPRNVPMHSTMMVASLMIGHDALPEQQVEICLGHGEGRLAVMVE